MRTRRAIRNVSLAALVVACLITGLVYVLPAAAGPAGPFGSGALSSGPSVPPRIRSVSPKSGPAGSTINITGSGFIATRTVAFAGAPASFRVVNLFLIQAVVPRTAGPGPITVTTRFGSAKSTTRFIVSPSIWFTPPYGPPTANVTVGGSGFGPSEQVAVTFNGTALPLATTDGKGIFATTPYQLPATALPGTEAVSAQGQTSGRRASASFLVNTDWAMLHDDLAHTGVNPYENVLNTTNVSTLTSAWTYATGSYISSSPTEVDGVLYVGSEDDNLYALDATTGAKKWSFPTGGFVESPPAIANGVVYFGSYDNNLYALDAATGTLLWSFPTGNNVETSPAVVNGVVYFGSDDGNVYALNATTGALIWSYKTGGIVGNSPAVVGGVVYVGSGDFSVYALDAATGAKKWSYKTGSLIDSSPAVYSGVVYIGSYDQTVYALDASAGTLKWSYKTTGAVVSSPAVYGGVVFVGSNDQNLYALDAGSGVVDWTFHTGSAIQSSPAAAYGVLYVGSEDGTLYAFDAGTVGAPPLWSYPTASLSAFVSSPAVANGMVYIGCNDFNIYAFKLPPPAVRRHQQPRSTLRRVS